MVYVFQRMRPLVEMRSIEKFSRNCGKIPTQSLAGNYLDLRPAQPYTLLLSETDRVLTCGPLIIGAAAHVVTPETRMGSIMARRCELTGKAVLAGNNVSHANNKTRRRFLPNLCTVSLLSEALDRKVRLKISAAALRTVEHRGGLDAFLLKAREKDLPHKAIMLRREIIGKLKQGPDTELAA